MLLRSAYALLLATSLLHANPPGEPAPEDLGFALFRDRCIACHLQTGMGIREMNAPSIAGLPRWYVADQLRKFRSARRGFHEEDPSGILMQANAMALDERSIAFVSRYIESLEPNRNRKSDTAKATNSAASSYQNHCSLCHGDLAEGDRSGRVPPLNRQQDWYLLKQMENFRTGKRPHHSETGQTELSADIAESIISWISSLHPSE